MNSLVNGDLMSSANELLSSIKDGGDNLPVLLNMNRRRLLLLSTNGDEIDF
uniref:Bm12388 n=1 Tax=Brugia malayi TaxID=6279 RepID=A0A1I9GBL7_BRUMA|nr:Bm12388 [Brugia malayi]